jgi:hypothetical protein
MPKGQEGVKELVRVACSKSKMNLLDTRKGNARTESEESRTRREFTSREEGKARTTVVFPALPFSPSILNQRAPLSWFYHQ